MVGSLLRSRAAVGAALAVAAGLASALTACASGTSNSPVGAASVSVPAPSAPSATPSASPPTTPSPSPSTVNPGGPMSTVPAPSSAPPALTVTTPPAKSKYVPIEQETRSPDGRTLYLETEARGGACGQFAVVLRESTSDVHVGLAQLEPPANVMCPMYIGPRRFTVKLSSPVGARPVIDLATGKPVR